MRKAIFWIHLLCGTIAGIIIFIMSVTGVLLMYERQMIAWSDREFRSSSGARLEPQALLASIRAATGKLPATLVLQSEPEAPVEATFGPGEIVYFDASTGRRLGEASKSMRGFMRSVTDLHRWLMMQGPNRPTGKAITGAANLAFLFLVVSGIYIWLPRKWTAQSVRAVLWFRGGLTGKARDFNWHNAIGIWSAIPLFFIVLGALVISYPAATNFLYGLDGPPPTPAPKISKTAGDPTLANINSAWRNAELHMSDWQTINLRVPTAPGTPYVFTVLGSHRGRPDKRLTVTVHPETAEVLHTDGFANYGTWRQFRGWLRFLHTGEALGIAGQTIAGLVSAGAAVLAYTGVALSWRRYRAWRARA